MKSIYNPDDLRCNSTGLQINFEAKEFFKIILEKYSEYNPREIVELISVEFSHMVSRRILELRRMGILKHEDVNVGSIVNGRCNHGIPFTEHCKQCSLIISAIPPNVEEKNMICKICNKEIEISCPCGNCDIKTKFSVCSICEPENFIKVNKMKSINICVSYLKKQLEK